MIDENGLQSKEKESVVSALKFTDLLEKINVSFTAFILTRKNILNIVFNSKRTCFKEPLYKFNILFN